MVGFQRCLRTASLVRVPAPSICNEGLTQIDWRRFPAADEITPTPEESVYEATRNDDIAAAIASLNAREQDILNRYFGLEGNPPHTLEEIGQVYHLTRERVRQIRDRALVRLRNSPFTSALSEYAQN